jgi:hypothetical protein
MAANPPSEQVDIQALRDALASAKLHLDTALGQAGAGDAAGVQARLRAAAANNTGCNNTSCGRGVQALSELPAQQAQQQ